MANNKWQNVKVILSIRKGRPKKIPHVGVVSPGMPLKISMDTYIRNKRTIDRHREIMVEFVKETAHGMRRMSRFRDGVVRPSISIPNSIKDILEIPVPTDITVDGIIKAIENYKKKMQTIAEDSNKEEIKPEEIVSRDQESVTVDEDFEEKTDSVTLIKYEIPVDKREEEIEKLCAIDGIGRKSATDLVDNNITLELLREMLTQKAGRKALQGILSKIVYNKLLISGLGENGNTD